jgi:hypothetical protein
MAHKYVWYDPKLDTSEFTAELGKVPRLSTRQVGSHTAIVLIASKRYKTAIDDFAELATGNREYFWDRPVGIG